MILPKIDSFSPQVRRLWQKLDPCTCCPRNCRVNRLAGETGYCGTGPLPVISSAGPHFGEESVLVGKDGSGTVFFTGCNLRCVFCQNYDISRMRRGREISIDQLAQQFLSLQQSGCENINLVTPSHQAPAIAAALEKAKQDGLTVPVVYNSGGYDSVQTLDLLSGFIDIYMPDFKYSDPEISARLSDAADYPDVCKKALGEMHRQVGELLIDKSGVAIRGLLVRHLVLPGDLSGSKEVLEFLAGRIWPSTAVNIMDQYRPCFHAARFEEINTCPDYEIIKSLRQYARTLGLRILP